MRSYQHIFGLTGDGLPWSSTVEYVTRLDGETEVIKVAGSYNDGGGSVSFSALAEADLPAQVLGGFVTHRGRIVTAINDQSWNGGML